MHEALLNIDLPSAYRILRMIKGRPKQGTAGYVTVMQPMQPMQQQPVGPAKGIQKGMTKFTNHIRGTIGSAIGSAFVGPRGGARTRRNKHRRSRTNKVKRQH